MKLPAKPSPAALACAREISFTVPSQKNDAARIVEWAGIIDRHMLVFPFHSDERNTSDHVVDIRDPVRDERNSREPEEMIARAEREKHATRFSGRPAQKGA